MKVSVVKGGGASGRKHKIYVARDDGSEASWLAHRYDGTLPHDLVHFVVETAYGLRGGLWGCVAAGHDLQRINDAANREGGADKYASLGDEIIRAEELANSDDHAEHIVAALQRVTTRWLALPEKASLELTWPCGIDDL
jgi:hypothetical protein